MSVENVALMVKMGKLPDREGLLEGKRKVELEVNDGRPAMKRKH